MQLDLSNAQQCIKWTMLMYVQLIAAYIRASDLHAMWLVQDWSSLGHCMIQASAMKAMLVHDILDELLWSTWHCVTVQRWWQWQLHTLVSAMLTKCSIRLWETSRTAVNNDSSWRTVVNLLLDISNQSRCITARLAFYTHTDKTVKQIKLPSPPTRVLVLMWT